MFLFRSGLVTSAAMLLSLAHASTAYAQCEAAAPKPWDDMVGKPVWLSRDEKLIFPEEEGGFHYLAVPDPEKGALPYGKELVFNRVVEYYPDTKIAKYLEVSDGEQSYVVEDDHVHQFDFRECNFRHMLKDREISDRRVQHMQVLLGVPDPEARPTRSDGTWVEEEHLEKISLLACHSFDYNLAARVTHSYDTVECVPVYKEGVLKYGIVSEPIAIFYRSKELSHVVDVPAGGL